MASFHRRGQIALEYLTTYGFALLVLLSTLGVLTYLGVFNLNSVRPSECNFPTGVKCFDYRFASGSAIALNLTNEYGVNLTLIPTRVNATFKQDGSGTPVACGIAPRPGPNAWENGNELILTCNPPASLRIVSGQRYDLTIQLAFTQEGGSFEHAIRGTVGATAR